jgi:hypothetical protein
MESVPGDQIMPYVVNLMDLHAISRHPIDGMIVRMLITPHISQEVVQVEYSRVDGDGVKLTCDDEQAEAIIAAVRTHYKRNSFRFYHSTTGKGGWKRVTNPAKERTN